MSRNLATLLLAATNIAIGCGDDTPSSSSGTTSASSTGGPTSTGAGRTASVTASTTDSAGSDATTASSGTSASSEATTGTDGSTASGTTSSGDASTSDESTSSSTGVGGIPEPQDDDYTTDEDVPLDVTAALGVLGNDTDPDDDPLTVVDFDAASANGGTVVVGSDGAFTYTPLPNFNGADSFGYTAADDGGGSASATVNITVGPVNDDPVAVDDLHVILLGSGPLVVAAPGPLGNDVDIDGDALQMTSIGAGGLTESGGDVVGAADGSFTYTPISTPTPPFWGEDRFEYVVSDGITSDVGEIRAVVSPTTISLGTVAFSHGGFRIDGENANDNSGWSVRAAGDVNGDGLADLIVGAPEAQSAAGRSYVVFGKTDDDPIALPDVTSGTGGFALDGENAGDGSGYSVSGAGDVNGDGLADLIVGAYGFVGYSAVGHAYVVFGKQTTTTVALSDVAAGSGGFLIDGTASGNLNGRAVSGAGDVNGDGLADLVMGARLQDIGGESYVGRSYVVFGKTDGTAVDLADIQAGTGGFVMDGELAVDLAGDSVSGLGDVDGDGLADVAVGAQGVDAGGNVNAGRVYVVFGRTATTPVALADIADGSGGFAIDGAAASDWAGISVGGAGDVNGDGHADVIVGAPGADPGGVAVGTSYVVFGKADTGLVALADVEMGMGGFAIHGEMINDFFAWAVSGAGDVDGDGLDDVIIGAFSADFGNFAAGRSYVVYGKSDTAAVEGSDLADGSGGFVTDGLNLGDSSGKSVSGAGDVDGDGFADLIIGAYNRTIPPGATYAGSSLVVFGGNFVGAVTHSGTDAAESMAGTAGDDVIVAGAGNDTLVSSGGADVLYAGSGDDTISIVDDGFARIDGGTGDDILRLEGDGTTVDLTTVPALALCGIETIDLTGSGDNSLTLDLSDLLWMSDSSNALTVEGDDGDSLDADLTGGGFIDNGSVGGFAEYSNGILTLRVADQVTAIITL